MSMYRCPFCTSGNTIVLKSIGGTPYKRFRRCKKCKKGFTTIEASVKSETDEFLLFINDEAVQRLVSSIIAEISTPYNIRKLATKITQRHQTRLTRLLGV